MKTKPSVVIPLLALAAISLSTPAIAVVPKISVGEDHMLLLKTDGSVWGWGANGSGQLGIGDASNTLQPQQVLGLTGVTDVVARQGGFSMALKADGTVWVWGSNSDGLSGAITYGGVFRNVPTQVASLHNIVSIAATMNGYAALATDKDGNVWAWGNGDYGRLGDGLTAKRGVPAKVPGVTGIVRVIATNNQVAALGSDGTVYSWGSNNRDDSLRTGQSKDGYAKAAVANVPKLKFLEAVYSNQSGMFMGIDAQNRVMTWGDTNSGLLTCHQNIGTASVSSLTQPYYPTGLNNIQQIAGGNTYALFLDSNKNILGCGANDDGELGDGTTKSTTPTSPIKYGPVAAAGVPANVAYIAAGIFASAAITADGSVYTWGRASSGLGGTSPQTGNNNLQPTAVSINAGAGAAAPATFAGTQAGTLQGVSVDVGIAVAPAHVGQTGEIYIAAVLTNGTMLLLNSAGSFVAYDPTKPITPFFQGALPANLPLPLVSNANLAGFAGTTLIIGYGLGTGSTANADLLNSNGRYKSVLTLQ